MNIACKFEWGISPYNINTLSSNKMDIVVPLGVMIPSLNGGGSGDGVESVNGKTGKHITLEASDLGTYTRSEIDARIPTKLSDLGNDVGYLTEGGVDTKLESKQDVLPNNGDGTKYLSDDGTYKEIQPTVDAYTKTETDTLLDDKADKNSISVVGYSNDYSDLDNKPANISTFNNDVGYLTQHQDISDKVDKEAGKGLSTNDYSNADKTLVSKIITDGTGDKYLSDDGSYKEVSGGGGGGGVSESDVKGWISRNIAVNDAYSIGGPRATGSYAIASGYNSSATGVQSVALGRGARAQGTDSIAIGNSSNVIVMTGDGGVSIGASSWSNAESVALGTKSTTGGFKNCTSLGYQAATTSANQVQLGNSSTTVYAYGAVQDRSDARDKANVRDIALGLDFINKLRPVEYRWDYREDYFRDIAPQRDDFEDEETYIQALEQARADFFKNPVKDGSKTRTRHHTGLIAQEVKQAMDDLGVDFGGFQHHQEKGGLDVMSLGYNELIAVLIKAVQEVNLKCEKLQGELDVFRSNI